MPSAWYIVPYQRRPSANRPLRYCQIDDQTPDILADGGWWSEVEILGNRAIVKVRASAAILQNLNGLYKRLPKDVLNIGLSDLNNAQKIALRNEILDQGYTIAEIRARFGDDLGQYTLGDILRFMATRRKEPRYDAETDTIVLDGPDHPCRSIDSLDKEVG